MSVHFSVINIHEIVKIKIEKCVKIDGKGCNNIDILLEDKDGRRTSIFCWAPGMVWPEIEIDERLLPAPETEQADTLQHDLNFIENAARAMAAAAKEPR